MIDPIDSSFPSDNLLPASTYLDYIRGAEGTARDRCLAWVQVCRFARELPPGLELLADRVASLGIDRLGLHAAELNQLLNAVAGEGVGIPGTELKLRVVRPWRVIIEPAAGGEPLLPPHWLEGLELHGDPASLWIGRRVPAQPLCPAPIDAESIHRARKPSIEIDRSKYEPSRHGWKLLDSAPWPAMFEVENGP